MNSATALRTIATTALITLNPGTAPMPRAKPFRPFIVPGQRYGVGYLSDVLQGRENDRVRALGHQHLSVFGIGKALNDHQWRSLFRQLVARGLIDVDVEGFGGLRLCESCRPLLRGETTLLLRRDLSTPSETPRS